MSKKRKVIEESSEREMEVRMMASTSLDTAVIVVRTKDGKAMLVDELVEVVNAYLDVISEQSGDQSTAHVERVEDIEDDGKEPAGGLH